MPPPPDRRPGQLAFNKTHPRRLNNQCLVFRPQLHQISTLLMNKKIKNVFISAEKRIKEAHAVNYTWIFLEEWYTSEITTPSRIDVNCQCRRETSTAVIFSFEDGENQGKVHVCKTKNEISLLDKPDPLTDRPQLLLQRLTKR